MRKSTLSNRTVKRLYFFFLTQISFFKAVGISFIFFSLEFLYLFFSFYTVSFYFLWKIKKEGWFFFRKLKTRSGNLFYLHRFFFSSLIENRISFLNKKKISDSICNKTVRPHCGCCLAILSAKSKLNYDNSFSIFFPYVLTNIIIPTRGNFVFKKTLVFSANIANYRSAISVIDNQPKVKHTQQKYTSTRTEWR